MSYLQTALKVVDQVGKDNKRDDSIKSIGKGIVIKLPTEDRRETLLNCMTATWETVSRPYFKIGYKMTPEIKKAETEIEKIQADVLAGKVKLEDFRNVCLVWEETVKSFI